MRGLGKDIMRKDKDFEAMRLENAKYKLREEAQKVKAEQEKPKSGAKASARRSPPSEAEEGCGSGVVGRD